MKRLSELENLRDDIITNYEKRDSRSALCESDLNLLKKWQWNRCVYVLYPNLYDIDIVNATFGC